MMRPVSDAWKAAITSSHQMVSRVRLVTAGQTGVNPGPLDGDGNPLYILDLAGGDVTFDATADIRATADVTTLTEWPTSVDSRLHVYRRWELFIERGLVYGDGVREWCSLGYYRSDKLRQQDAPSGPIQVSAADRMSGIINARLHWPRYYDAAASWRVVIEDLVQDVYPGLTCLLSGFNADAAIGTQQIVERERFSFLNNIAKSHGCVMHFDYAGRFVMAPVPDPKTQTPVWTVGHGKGGVLVNLSREIDATRIFNAVVADGEQASDQPPVQGFAFDLDPNSPTWWDGPFGQVPKFFSSSFLRTNEQATAAAQAMLNRSLGLPYSIDFQMVPNPALEVLDLVRVTYSDRFAAEGHVLDRLTIPLTATGAMTGETRVRVVSDDD